MIGFFAVSLFIYIIYIASSGRAFGGGDVKLMAACGLVMGWQLAILSFFLACIIGSVVHMVKAEDMIADIENEVKKCIELLDV